MQETVTLEKKKGGALSHIKEDFPVLTETFSKSHTHLGVEWIFPNVPLLLISTSMSVLFNTRDKPALYCTLRDRYLHFQNVCSLWLITLQTKTVCLFTPQCFSAPSKFQLHFPPAVNRH